MSINQHGDADLQVCYDWPVETTKVKVQFQHVLNSSHV